MPRTPIGVFDSGIGGFSVLREIRKILPTQPLIYIADQANVPYGERTGDQVRSFSRAMTSFLENAGCRVVAVACNTASAAALYTLREEFPHLHIVGMEPALKPAANSTQTKTVGILATNGTFEGEPYRRLKEKYGHGIRILETPCPGLARMIEEDNPEISSHLRDWIEPMLDDNADRIVLGCTHYPLVKHLISSIVGNRAQILDPSEAVALQVGRMHAQHSSDTDLNITLAEMASVTLYTTSDPEVIRTKAEQLLWPKISALPLRWNGKVLTTI